MKLLTKEELGDKQVKIILEFRKLLKNHIWYKKRRYLCLQLGAPIVSTILLEDILVTLNSKTAVLKIDVETMECKVYYKFINEVMLNSLQSLFFYIRFLSILTNFLIPQESSFPLSS
jgi:hypothetical protein